MIGDKLTRPVTLAHYFLDNNSTVRGTAEHFGLSKSTVHKDLTQALPVLSPALYDQVRKLLNRNADERHIRGGISTRNKWEQVRYEAFHNDYCEDSY